MTERTHFVYRIFDDRGLLLYVGCTANFEKRMRQHRADRKHGNNWIGFTDHAKLEGPFTKDRGFAREKEVIESDRPYFNVSTEHRRIAHQRNTMKDRLLNDLRRDHPGMFVMDAPGELPAAFIAASEQINRQVDQAIPPADAAYRHRTYLNDRVAAKVVA